MPPPCGLRTGGPTTAKEYWSPHPWRRHDELQVQMVVSSESGALENSSGLVALSCWPFEWVARPVAWTVLETVDGWMGVASLLQAADMDDHAQPIAGRAQREPFSWFLHGRCRPYPSTSPPPHSPRMGSSTHGNSPPSVERRQRRAGGYGDPLPRSARVS
jgi:hypothetical protein